MKNLKNILHKAKIGDKKIQRNLAIACISAVVILCFIFLLLKINILNDKNSNVMNSTKNFNTEVGKQNLNNTIITPYMNSQIVTGNNLVYCSTFQLAWNELKDNIIKGNIIIDGNPAGANFLNEGLSRKNDISEKYYVAMAGYNKDNIIGKINRKLKEKFGASAPKVTEKLVYPEDILAYSYLNVDLQFMYKFNELNQPINFKNTKVNAFGIKKYNYSDAKIGNQVNILYYKNDSDFIINLKTQNSKDEIILANIDPQNTLLDTINDVNSRVKVPQKQGLNIDDTLEIPVIHLYAKKDFSEFENRRLLNSGFEQYEIAKAVQDINFNLDNSGAKLKSEAEITVKITARNPNMNPKKQKHLIFNKPFLLMLKQQGKTYPYFAMWIDNSNMLK